MFRCRRLWQLVVVVSALHLGIAIATIRAQVPQPLAGGNQAYVVVEGNVKQVFRNLQPAEPAYLVQMSVLRSEVQRALPPGATVQIPAPGQLLYVQMGAPGTRRSQLAVPNPQQRLRALLVPAADGGWAGTFPEWVDGSGAVQAEAEPGGAAMGPASTTAPGSLLGMTTELVKVQVSAVKKSGPQLELIVRDSRTGRNTPVQVKLGGPEPATSWPPASSTPRTGGTRSDLGVVTELAFHNDEFAVKVTEVESGSPAARAGIRPGMLTLNVNDKPVLHPKELTDAVRQSGKTAKLQVVDPRTGRTSSLDVAL